MNEPSFDAQIARLLDKVARINQLSQSEPDPKRAVARARALYAPLTEQAVRSFELAQGVELPADYRAFLIKAGNGGGPIGIAGGSYPDWGVALYPLEHWHAATDQGDAGPGFLSAPSPLKPIRDSDEEAWDQGEDPGDYWFRGAIALGQEGCGWFSLLIVSGPFRGRIASCDGGYTRPHVADVCFLDWYERSLDHALAC